MKSRPQAVFPLARPPRVTKRRLLAWLRGRPDWWQRRHLAAIALVVVVPWLLRLSTPRLGPRDSALGVALMLVGALVGAAGLVAYGAFVRTERRARRPDEAGQDPPPALLGDDAFAQSRNPHGLGVIALVATQAAWIDCTPLVLYALVLPIALHYWVQLREEPRLRARFGEAYDEYALRVPRWLPWERIGVFLRAMAEAVRRLVRRG